MPCSLAVLKSPVMFEVKLQTYWGDADPAGIVFFPHFFKYVEHAEEDLFRAAGANRQEMLEENGVWMPRVEAFSKFMRPIRAGAAIRVRLDPQFEGQKTVRYNFEIVDDVTGAKQAEGYVTVVCVDTQFKSTPIPDAIRAAITTRTHDS
jgi:YbgC/YbaW family acyl-CoA thioester hydrolase